MEIYKCSKCKDTHKCINDFGVEVVCDCVLREDLGIKTESKINKPVYSVSEQDKKVVLARRLIPEHRIDDDFSIEKTKSNIISMNRKKSFQVCNFDAYETVLADILTNVRANKKLNKSYLIGAPNGFGKTTFVHTCLKIMSKLNRKVVPYISLLELAELLKRHRESLLRADAKVVKKYNEIEIIEDKTPVEVCWNSYDWTEYMSSDILFIYFTSVENKVIESRVLQTILSIRGVRGLPTVSFISTSLDPYLNDEKLSEYIWDDMLAYTSGKNYDYDRLTHISTYKKWKRG